MRLALLLHGWPAEEVGGTGLYVGALARALAAQGHAVTTLAPRLRSDHHGPPRVVGARAEPGTEAFVIEAAPPRRWEQTWRRPDLDAALRGWLARQAPDLVHVHHLSHASLGWLRAVRASGAGLVLTLHDYALPCARGQLVDRDLRPCAGPSPARCAACLGEHLQLSPATAAVGSALERWPALRARAREFAARHATPARPSRAALLRVETRQQAVAAALHLPHRLLSPSHDLAARFAALGLRRPEHFPLPLLHPIGPAPPPGVGPLRLLFASALIPTKGPDRLLAAFQRLPPGAATLTLAGPAPPYDGRPGWAADLRARVEATAGARWLGAVPSAQVPALLAAHDVLVLPSTWPENSPLVVREASAAGLRLVLPLAGGAGELAPQARLVPAGDDEALLAALHQEVRAGRGRVPPLAWPDPHAHALALSREVYAPVAGRQRG